MSYATRHGYDVVVGDGQMPEPRQPAWAKVPLVRRLLDSYELVLWLDADTMILDCSRDIAEELDSESFQALVAHGHSDGGTPNTGVWLLRGNDRGRAFMDTVWNTTDFADELGWWENSAVIHLLGLSCVWPPRLINPDADWLVGTQWLPDDWNRMTNVDPDPGSARIHHLAGERHSFRLLQMTADAHRIEGHLWRERVTRFPWTVVVLLRQRRAYSVAKQAILRLQDRFPRGKQA